MKLIGTCVGALVAAMLTACQQGAVSSTSTDSVTAVAEATVPAIQAKEIVGVWFVKSIENNPVADNSPARIQFTEDGSVNGNASCNRFSGSYSYEDHQLAISESLIATKMLCLPVLMKQEQHLFAVLPAAVYASVIDGELVLADKQGLPVIKAFREEK